LIFIKLIFAWPIIISVALFRPIGRKHRRSVFSAVWKPEQPHMVLRWPKQAATPKRGNVSCEERHWRSSAALRSAHYCWRWRRMRTRPEAAELLGVVAAGSVGLVAASVEDAASLLVAAFAGAPLEGAVSLQWAAAFAGAPSEGADSPRSEGPALA
jgi:hypothetical protein